MGDIEIARNIKLDKILEVAKRMNIEEDDVELYGKYKAKISLNTYKKLKDKKDGKLILITAINPTPLGEGKTTVAIGLADGLKRIGKESILALREPSLGPVFGIKGGATGGGHSQIAPMEDINLHFTGDIHAITSANNLLSAMIDNHIYFGNELGFERVIWKRCVDLNDRQLRKVETGLSGEKNIVPREDGFDITVASEIMAIFCLATDIEDLKRRIGNIIVGYTKNNEPITARDLKADGALTVLLKDAINPNLVQTLEHTPAIVHGGPFANIAHGCNSIIATKLAMKLADYTITEAGFGADLGALEKGIHNLLKHVDNLKRVYGLNVVVAINKYIHDTKKEIDFLQAKLKEYDVELSLVESWEKGGEGATDLAKKVVDLADRESQLKYAYQLDNDVKSKIKDIATKIYGASDVIYSEEANSKINQIEKMGYSNLPICIAKTQYSLSDDPKNLACEEPFQIHVQDVKLKAGAEFIVVMTGKIMTMPGLPRVPAAEKIDIDKDENIVGIF